MTIVGLDHVQLAIPAGGEPEARRFYGAVLGLKEEAKPAPLEARGGCWFRGGGAHLHLGVDGAFVAATRAHPALLVADLDEVARRLREAGAPAADGDDVDGRRRMYTDDPFGNRIELIQQGDGFSER